MRTKSKKKEYLISLKIIKFYIILIISTLIINSAYSLENKILFKIDNEIITSIDLKNEIFYLLNLNQNMKQLSKNQVFEISKESLIREKIKKKNILRFFGKIDVEENITNNFIKNFYERLNIESKKDLDNYLEKNGLNIGYVEEKINIEVMWNRLVYYKYKSQVKIDNKKIRDKVLENKSKNSKSYFLQEIVFELQNNENPIDKYNKIIQNIKNLGFEETALIYSVSNSQRESGNVGWVNENTISQNILNKIENISVGDITPAIRIPGGFLILKIKDVRSEEKEIDVEKEISKIIKEKTNEQLNQFSLIFYSRLKKDVVINEL
tara:strand:+ start:892 stop:1860 length:969 start_codon:yes stop_codon:yes gene_type:complete